MLDPTPSRSPQHDNASTRVYSRRKAPWLASRKACDSCRVRKTRCEPSSTTALEDATTSSSFYTAARYACAACKSADIKCTFDLPIKKRGPVPRSKAARTDGTSPLRTTYADQQIVTTVSPLSDPETQSSLRTGLRATESWTNVNGHATSEAEAVTQNANTPGSYDEPIFDTGQGLNFEQAEDSSFVLSDVCGRTIMHSLMQDYLDLLYHTVPIVHQPTFQRNLAGHREDVDTTFAALLAAISAYVIAVVPGKFERYRAIASGLRFDSRDQMVDHCYRFVLRLRDVDYFDHVTHTKWAISYLFSTTYFQLGWVGRIPIIQAECQQQSRMMGFHKSRMYKQLNCIEAQLHKKAFWLTFYSYVHTILFLTDHDFLHAYDTSLLKNIKLDDLMPAEVDDEYILEDTILPQPASQFSLTTGFNALAHVFWVAHMSTNPSKYESPGIMNPLTSDAANWRPGHLLMMRERLDEMKYLLDELDPILSQWNPNPGAWAPSPETSSSNRRYQVESMRANIHSTHLWFQNVLCDQILLLAAKLDPQQNEQTPEQLGKEIWNRKEEICRQLLQTICGINSEYLLAAGHELTFKIREVATSLLDCPFAPDSNIAKRVNGYVKSFTVLLARLDSTPYPNCGRASSMTESPVNI